MPNADIGAVAIVREAKQRGCVLEIELTADRLDLDDVYWSAAYKDRAMRAAAAASAALPPISDHNGATA